MEQKCKGARNGNSQVKNLKQVKCLVSFCHCWQYWTCLVMSPCSKYKSAAVSRLRTTRVDTMICLSLLLTNSRSLHTLNWQQEEVLLRPNVCLKVPFAQKAKRHLTWLTQKWWANETCRLRASRGRFDFVVPYESVRWTNMENFVDFVPLQQCPPHTQG